MTQDYTYSIGTAGVPWTLYENCLLYTSPSPRDRG